MVVYIYFAELLLIIYLLLVLIRKSFICPLKIKVISLCILSVLILRYITLIAMFILKDITYIYFFKYFVLLNIICVPALAILMIFIFGRTKKINILYIIGSILLFVILYLFIIIKIPIVVKPASDYGFGYIVSFMNCGEYIVFVYIMIYIVLITGCGFFLGKSYINKTGISFLMISLLVNLVENITLLIGTKIMPEYLLGEILCMLSLNYAFELFKK